MSKTITLRIRDEVYELFRTLAENDNRTLSNFIETAALRHIEENEFADEYEMVEIRDNKELNRSLKQALKDAKAGRGQFVE